jgi:hypothetical protein
MTRRQNAHGSEAPRRQRFARGIVRRALTDPAIFDAIIAEADAGTPEERSRVVLARRLLLAARERRPWTPRAERRLAAYSRSYRAAGRKLPSAERRPMSLLLAWAEVPDRRGR